MLIISIAEQVKLCWIVDQYGCCPSSNPSLDHIFRCEYDEGGQQVLSYTSYFAAVVESKTYGRVRIDRVRDCEPD